MNHEPPDAFAEAVAKLHRPQYDPAEVAAYDWWLCRSWLYRVIDSADTAHVIQSIAGFFQGDQWT